MILDCLYILFKIKHWKITETLFILKHKHLYWKYFNYCHLCFRLFCCEVHFKNKSEKLFTSFCDIFIWEENRCCCLAKPLARIISNQKSLEGEQMQTVHFSRRELDKRPFKWGFIALMRKISELFLCFFSVMMKRFVENSGCPLRHFDSL